MATNATVCITAGRKSGGFSRAARACGGPLKATTVEVADPSGILRGLGWGLAIEGTGLVLLYGIWHALWHVASILRP
jgi:hypothetical protein